MLTRGVVCLLAVLVLPTHAKEMPVPLGFPQPAALDYFGWSTELAELGRHLFYDARLSVNQTVSCATCHQQRLAFSDGEKVSIGASGVAGKRSSMPLINLAYRDSLGWAEKHTFIDQLDRPLFGQDPIEMGASEVPQSIKLDEDYRPLFKRAYGEFEVISWGNIKMALVAFELTLISGNSEYDQWLFQDKRPSKAFIEGMQLFFSERLGCSGCHGGVGFNNEFFIAGADTHSVLERNGLLDTQAAFRIPTLRNIEYTAPYMHDGRFISLRQVIEFYGNGPNPNNNLNGFSLSPKEMSNLITFLHGLSDASFLTDPRFSKPD